MVIEKARELGKALVESPQFKAYAAARDEIEGDLTATNLMSAYAEKEKEIARQLTQKTVDREAVSELSKQIQLLKTKIDANAELTYYFKVKGEFEELVNTANAVIAHFVNPDSKEEGCSGCGGGCPSGCSGCGVH